MHPEDKGHRKRIRYFKGMRRANERVAGHRCSWWCFKSSSGCDSIAFDDKMPSNWWCERHNGLLTGRGKRFAVLADYPKVCSCMGCGNQRHAYDPQPTVQERRRAPLRSDYTDPDGTPLR